MATTPTKKSFSCTIKDFYAEYRKERKKTIATKDVIPYNTYKEVFREFFLAISKKIIYENFTFMMPYGLGSLLVKSRKVNPKDAAIDYNLSKIYKKPIKHLNTHSFGYTFSVFWDKSYVRFKNYTMYLYKNTKSKQAQDKGIGRKGLSDEIIRRSNNPNERSYLKM
jgi:hypothetical protein